MADSVPTAPRRFLPISRQDVPIETRFAIRPRGSVAAIVERRTRHLRSDAAALPGSVSLEDGGLPC
jgi:hypothetical protein